MENRRGKKSTAQRKAEDTARTFASGETVKQDPSGSYTGRPKDGREKPVQDADDL